MRRRNAIGDSIANQPNWRKASSVETDVYTPSAGVVECRAWAAKETFANRVRNGAVTAAALSDFVAAWHRGGDPRPLHEAIGFTREQYGRWLRGEATAAELLRPVPPRARSGPDRSAPRPSGAGALPRLKRAWDLEGHRRRFAACAQVPAGR